MLFNLQNIVFKPNRNYFKDTETQKCVTALNIL